MSRTTSYGFLVSCQNLEKTNYTIPRNAWTDGRTDRQTLFYKTLAANAKGLIHQFFIDITKKPDLKPNKNSTLTDVDYIISDFDNPDNHKKIHDTLFPRY